MIRLHHLPVEILSLIVSNINHEGLYHCSLVNKQFYAATTPVLWRAPNVDDEAAILRLSKSLSSARHALGHYIRRLTFGEALLDDVLILFINHTVLLEELTILHADHITDKSIQYLSLQCPQLKKLHLANGNITHRSIHYLGQHCRRLCELALKRCHRLLPITLLPFVDCPLEYLDLSECKWLTGEDTALDLVQFHRLKHLELVCSRTIDAKFLQQLLLPSTNENNNTRNDGKRSSMHYPKSIALPLLTYFAITGSSDVNDQFIIPFIKTHPHLVNLHLLKCNLTDAVLDAISTYLPDIRVLDLLCCENISARAVRQLIRNCPLMLMIGLKSCLIPKHAFPELESKDRQSQYIHFLGYDDIVAIRLSPANDDEESNADDTVNEADQISTDSSLVEEASDRLEGSRHQVQHGFQQHDNDDMNEVRAIVLSLTDNLHYSI